MEIGSLLTSREVLGSKSKGNMDEEGMDSCDEIESEGHAVGDQDFQAESTNESDSADGSSSDAALRLKQMTDRDLIDLSIRDLNHLLKRADRDTASRLKQRRRTLKNRGYAQSCRSRRVQVTGDLEKSKRELEEQISATTEELNCMRQERDWYKRQLLTVLKTKGASREELKAQLMTILTVAQDVD